MMNRVTSAINEQLEDTPPPPSLSEAPPSYATLDPNPISHTSRSYFSNPIFHETDVIEQALNYNSGEHHDNNEGGTIGDSDLPPPYSPGPQNIRGPDNVYDAPPSYYSLFGQIREAREQTNNNFEFLRRVGQIILNTVGCTILLIVFMSVPITVLVLGAVYVPQCPLEPHIPIYLIIAGLSGILKNIFLIIESIVKRKSRSLSSRVKHSKYYVLTWRAANLIFNLFMLAWIIAGSYWVYHIYREVNNTKYKNCNELLYKFAFGIVTSSYILLVLICCCTCCCAGVCLRRRKNSSSREDRESSESESDNESQTRGVDDREGANPDDDSSIASQSNQNQRDVFDDTFDTGDTDPNAFDTNISQSRVRRSADMSGSNPSTPFVLNNGTIMQFDTSPYPSRHQIHRLGPISNPQRSSFLEHGELDSGIIISEYTNSPVLSPSSRHFRNHNPHSSSTEIHSQYSNPVRIRRESEVDGSNGVRRSSELYITESSEGYSVTTV